MKKIIIAFALLSGTCYADTGDIPLSSNFQENSGRPLDARITVSSATARLALPSTQVYDGMMVYQRSDQTTWQLQGSTFTWVEIIPSSSTTGGGSGNLVNLANHGSVTYYSAPGSSNTLSGGTNFTTDGSSITVSTVSVTNLIVSTMTVSSETAKNLSITSSLTSSGITLINQPQFGLVSAALAFGQQGVVSGGAIQQRFFSNSSPQTFASPLFLSESNTSDFSKYAQLSIDSSYGTSVVGSTNTYRTFAVFPSVLGTSTAVYVSSTGLVNIPGLTPSQCVQTDANNNLSSSGGSCGGGSSGSSSLGIFNGSVLISSPTSGISFDSNTISVILQGASTSYATLKASSVTLQGNFYSLAGLATSTGTLTTAISNIAVATTTLQTNINAVGVSTGSLAANVGFSTASLAFSIINIGISTSTLQTQVNTKINLSSITASVPITYNNGTGAIGFSQTIPQNETVVGSMTVAGDFGINPGTFTLVGSTTVINGVKMIWPSSGTIGGFLQYTSSNTLQFVPASTGGGVTSVSGTSPINSSGGATPAISLSQTINQDETFTSTVTIQDSGIIVHNPTDYETSITTGIGGTIVFGTQYNGNITISTPVLLGGSPGSSGQVFTSNGPGVAPSYQTPTAGGGGGSSSLEVLAGVRVTSPTATLSFGSGFTGTATTASTATITFTANNPVISTLSASTLTVSGLLLNSSATISNILTAPFIVGGSTYTSSLFLQPNTTDYGNIFIKELNNPLIGGVGRGINYFANECGVDSIGYCDASYNWVFGNPNGTVPDISMYEMGTEGYFNSTGTFNNLHGINGYHFYLWDYNHSATVWDVLQNQTFESFYPFKALNTIYFSSAVLLSGNAGTVGQVVTSQGPGNVPTWTTPSGSSGGGIVSPGTFTWTNNFGLGVSTLTISSNTILSGATFYAQAITQISSETVNSTLIVPTLNQSGVQAGDIRYDPTAGTYHGYYGIQNSTITFPGILFASAPINDILVSTTITSTETPFATQYTFKSGFWKQGTQVEIIAGVAGIATTTIPNSTFRFRLLKGGVTAASMIQTNATAAVASTVYIPKGASIMLTCQTTGTTGTMVANPVGWGTAPFNGPNAATASVISFDSTVDQVFQLTLQFTSSSASNIWRMDQISIRQLQ